MSLGLPMQCESHLLYKQYVEAVLQETRPRYGDKLRMMNDCAVADGKTRHQKRFGNVTPCSRGWRGLTVVYSSLVRVNIYAPPSHYILATLLPITLFLHNLQYVCRHFEEHLRHDS
jgi:hypothetical protein